MSEWIEKEIAELSDNNANAIVDGPFGSNLKISDYVDSGIPVLQGNNITGDKFLFRNIHYITEKKANELRRSSAKAGDLLVVKIGSVGYSAIIKNLGEYEYAIIPANLLKATFNKGIILTEFVYYFLTSPEMVL